MPIENIAIAAVMGAVYSIIFFAKKRANDPDEKYNYFKLIATIAVGIAIGIGFELSGVDFGQARLFEQLTAYVGTIALVESVLKLLWRQFLKGKISL